MHSTVERGLVGRLRLFTAGDLERYAIAHLVSGTTTHPSKLFSAIALIAARLE